MVSNKLTAKCGKTGFKNTQGVSGHERMCTKCQEIIKNGQQRTRHSSTQQPENKECHHYYRPLTAQEKAQRNSQGVSIGQLGFEVVCNKCGDMK